MATHYDDFINAGLLSPNAEREAALMGLFALGNQIGNRSAPRLSPTPPPMDLNAVMSVYQNQMNAALRRGALRKQMQDQEKLRQLFRPTPINEPAAQAIADARFNQVQSGTMDVDEMDADIDARASAARAAALPVARQMTTTPPILRGLPAEMRDVVGAIGQVDPRSAISMAGDVLKKMYTPSNKPSIVQEYEYARANGYVGTFEDYVKFAGASTAPKNFGTIPPGYRMKFDPQGRPQSLEVIPGGPAAEAEKESARAKQTGMVSQVQTARLVVDTADQILDIFKSTDMPVTGLASRALGVIPTLPAGRVRTLVAQLQSPIALGALTRLKNSSKTGASGFGALNTAELTLLIDEIGRLEPNTTAPDIFQDNVKRIRARYQRVIDNIKKEVSEEKIRELGLGALLGTTITSSGKKRMRWNDTTQKLEEVGG